LTKTPNFDGKHPYFILGSLDLIRKYQEYSGVLSFPAPGTVIAFSHAKSICGVSMPKEKSQEEAPPPAEKTKPKRSLKKILIMAVLGLLLVGGGLVAYVMFTDEPPVGKEAQASHGPSKNVVNMPLEPFLVNLADKESRRYLKLKVELEVKNEETAKELEKSMPRMRDDLILLLSSKTLPLLDDDWIALFLVPI
jgi:flagellar FliL protein